MKALSRARRRTPRSHTTTSSTNFWASLLGALGVVYGDIGTSPLYALKECFNGAHAVPLNPENILGILSLVFWAITLVVVVKYIFVIMRADNHGEGGIMALMALLMQKPSTGHTRAMNKSKIVLWGLFGAALLYGDGVITPAISVLSAVEGLEVATPVFHNYIVPITVAILVLLFFAQRGGTKRIGAVFGPATLLWFVSIAAIGLPWILKQPTVINAINPLFAVHFFKLNGLAGFLILGAVVLCITGGEALYADMGHFGPRPIRFAWYLVVFPALIINYFGQGALLLEHGREFVANPFYGLVPRTLLYPMVGLATVATVVASQALISGAFSLTHQAVQLGFLPRLSITHTCEHTEGQIYISRVNRLLMIGCISLVILFRESTHLAAAYGIAVTGTMTITSVLFYVVARQIWKWSLARAAFVAGFFLFFDIAFFTANTFKFFQGGWLPVAFAILIFILMSTWEKGRSALADAMITKSIPLDEFLARVEREKPHRVKGTAVFMTSTVDVAPGVLLHHFKHNQVLHENIVILTIVTKKIPYVSFDEHGRLTDLGNGFCKIVAKYGFMEKPDVMDILECGRLNLGSLSKNGISFYLGRETVLTTGKSILSKWRKRIFAILSRNAESASVFFNVPTDQVIELGSQVEL